MSPERFDLRVVSGGKGGKTLPATGKVTDVRGDQ